MIELKIRSILRRVKSEDPSKRFEAMDELYRYKQDDGLEIQIDVLREVVRTASSQFPLPVDKWDNPSYYLIDFACDFPMPEIVDEVLKNFEGFHPAGKERAIEFLLTTEDEKIFYVLEEKIVQAMQEDELILPVPQLSEYPMLVKGILDRAFEKIKTPHYKFYFYDLLLALNSSGMEQGYRKRDLVPLLLEDYETTKVEYLKYNNEYSAKFAYISWKESYFATRIRMRLLLNLFEYYYEPQLEELLHQALTYRDPLIRTEALLVCIEKNISFDKEILEECALNIESAEMVYWELKDKNKEHLYPFPTNKQPHLAKTRLFYTIVNLLEEEDEHIHFPENIQVLDKMETENSYGQPVRHYMMSFQENDVTYIGWTGGYALEDGEDTAHLWDGTYTEFIELDSLSIEAHKEAFLKKRVEDQEAYENTLYYQSKPRIGKGLWFLYALIITQWLRAFYNGEQAYYGFALILSAIAILLTVYQKRKNKKRSVSIIGNKLLIEDGKKLQEIELSNIKKVEYNKKHIIVTKKHNQEEIKFPLSWVRYEQFYYYMKEHTSHFKDVPYIEA